MREVNISGVRKNYSEKILDEKNIDANPFIQFQLWLDEAINTEIEEPTAMTLATSTKNGKPSARIVLLKEITEDGFVFYTNHTSRKGKELKQNPQAALVFHWKELERQIRIEGSVKRISEADSDKYFNSRPILSRISAIISPQSRIVPDRIFLEGLFVDYKNNSKNEIIRPENWGGNILIPDYFEFWQGRKSRLHDRICYKRLKKGWKINRLAP